MKSVYKYLGFLLALSFIGCDEDNRENTEPKDPECVDNSCESKDPEIILGDECVEDEKKCSSSNQHVLSCENGFWKKSDSCTNGCYAGKCKLNVGCNDSKTACLGNPESVIELDLSKYTSCSEEKLAECVLSNMNYWCASLDGAEECIEPCVKGLSGSSYCSAMGGYGDVNLSYECVDFEKGSYWLESKIEVCGGTSEDLFDCSKDSCGSKGTCGSICEAQDESYKAWCSMKSSYFACNDSQPFDCSTYKIGDETALQTCKTEYADLDIVMAVCRVTVDGRVMLFDCI